MLAFNDEPKISENSEINFFSVKYFHLAMLSFDFTRMSRHRCLKRCGKRQTKNLF